MGPGEFDGPFGICSDDKKVYVLDSEGVQVFDSDGNYIYSIFESKSEWLDIVVLTKRPHQFIMLSIGEIVRISLHYKICVQQQPQIEYTTLTLKHQSPNNLLTPQSLVMDEVGDRLYVSDPCKNKIMECQVDGTFIKWIGTGILDAPLGLCIQTHHLCVCDNGHHRISIFDRHTGTLIKHILANPSTLRPLCIISLGDQLLVSYEESQVLHVVEFEGGRTCRTITLPFVWRARTIRGMTLIDNIVFIIDSDDLVHRLS
jgi:NHL repeat